MPCFNNIGRPGQPEWSLEMILPHSDWKKRLPGRCPLEVFPRYKCFQNTIPDRLLGAWGAVVRQCQKGGVPREVRRRRGLAASGCVSLVLHPGFIQTVTLQIVLCAKHFV